jgi:alpha-tubulin suppressor-like RCC1 family protein
MNQRICAIATNGLAYCWGSNSYGQLGIGTSQAQTSIPTQVVLPQGVTGWKSIAGGVSTTCAVANTGQAYCWGHSEALGAGSSINSPQNSPVPVIRPLNVSSWKKVSMRETTACAIANTGKAYCWGSDNDWLRPAGAENGA